MNKIKEESYDFYLLDLYLPDGTGYEIFTEVKKQSDAPITFLTASDDEINVVRSLDMGADDYITKPFRIRELISRINVAIRHHRKTNTDFEHIQVRDIMVAPKLAKVYKNQKEIFLTALE